MKIRRVVLLWIVVVAMMSNGFAPAFSQTAEPTACNGQAASCRAGVETSAPVQVVGNVAYTMITDALTDGKLPKGVFVFRVYYDTVEDSQRLTGFDVFEYNNTGEKYWLAAVDAEGYRKLQALGFRVQVDEQETINFARLATPLAQQGEWIETDGAGIETIPGYTCYRTVEETYAAAQALADTHPDLATWTDIGDS